MTLHNYRSRQVHKTLNGVNPSSSFRDMRSAKSGPNLWQIWQVFGPWASPYGANGQITMTVHNYRPRQFHRTSNGENPSSGYRDMGSTSLAAARPPARTVTTIPLQPEGLRGKKEASPGTGRPPLKTSMAWRSSTDRNKHPQQYKPRWCLWYRRWILPNRLVYMCDNHSSQGDSVTISLAGLGPH